jgi:hypothetical protein
MQRFLLYPIRLESSAGKFAFSGLARSPTAAESAQSDPLGDGLSRGLPFLANFSPYFFPQVLCQAGKNGQKVLNNTSLATSLEGIGGTFSGRAL